MALAATRSDRADGAGSLLRVRSPGRSAGHPGTDLRTPTGSACLRRSACCSGSGSHLLSEIFTSPPP